MSNNGMPALLAPKTGTGAKKLAEGFYVYRDILTEAAALHANEGLDVVYNSGTKKGNKYFRISVRADTVSNCQIATPFSEWASLDWNCVPNHPDDLALYTYYAQHPGGDIPLL